MERSFTDHEKRFLIAEMIKSSEVPIQDLISFCRQLDPNWMLIELPRGRNLQQCLQAFVDMFGSSAPGSLGPQFSISPPSAPHPAVPSPASIPASASAPSETADTPAVRAAREALETAAAPRKRHTPPAEAAEPPLKRVATSSSRLGITTLTTSFSPSLNPPTPSSFPLSAPASVPPHMLMPLQIQRALLPQSASPIPKQYQPILASVSVSAPTPAPKRRGRPPRSSAGSRNLTPGPYPALAPHPAPPTASPATVTATTATGIPTPSPSQPHAPSGPSPGLRHLMPSGQHIQVQIGTQAHVQAQAQAQAQTDPPDPGTPSVPGYNVFSGMPPTVQPQRKRGRPTAAAAAANSSAPQILESVSREGRVVELYEPPERPASTQSVPQLPPPSPGAVLGSETAPVEQPEPIRHSVSVDSHYKTEGAPTLPPLLGREYNRSTPMPLGVTSNLENPAAT